jgi:hypothetical protein
MKKVKLSLDALHVESFPTGDAGRTGTVHAHFTPGPGCGYSDWDSCNESCTCPIASVCYSCVEPC